MAVRQRRHGRNGTVRSRRSVVLILELERLLLIDEDLRLSHRVGLAAVVVLAHVLELAMLLTG